MPPLVSPTGKPIDLPPIHPSAALRAGYQRRLDTLIAAMQADTARQVRRAYAAKPPELATDASPAVALNQVMRTLARKWQRRFDEGAVDLARYFATATKDRVDRVLMDALRKAGFAIKFQMTRAMNDAFQASVAENVGLIKSIPAEHLLGVQGAVMRSVQAGRDLGTLSKELQARYGVTKRRAALISRDQNNKATAVMTRARQEDLGITQARWLHSAGGKTPRPAHVAYSGKLYDVRKGAFIDGEWIRPGELINCRCVSISVVPGFD